MDAFDFDRFSTRKWVSNANYNYVVVFLGQMYWLFIYAPKHIFLIDHHCKTQSESFDALENCRDCLMFLQGVLLFLFTKTKAMWGGNKTYTFIVQISRSFLVTLISLVRFYFCQSYPEIAQLSFIVFLVQKDKK